MNILVINDTHCGSNYGIATEENSKTPYHKWVNKNFQQLVDYCKQFPIGIEILLHQKY